MYMKTAVLVSGLLALVSSQSTSVSRCIIASGDLPLNTYIDNCTSPPCQLPQLQDVVLNIVFQAPRTMRSMHTIAVAYLFGVFPFPYDLEENGITCNFLSNTYCPVMKDEVVQYTLKMFIEAYFPLGTSATVEFRIEDENNDPVFCIRLPIAIVAALPASRNGSTLVNAGGQ